MTLGVLPLLLAVFGASWNPAQDFRPVPDARTPSAAAVRFAAAVPVWPEGRANETNSFFGFRADFTVPSDGRPVLKITSANVYRVFVDGRFVGHGPVRAPHGYSRTDEWPLDVKIVIIGGGVAYGELGMSHHSTEDIAIMRALPNMVVLVPSDGAETRAATHAMMDYKGPVYFRCGYKNEPDLHDGKEVAEFRIGGSSMIRDGKDATVFFAGTIGVDAKKAVEELEKEKGISCCLISLYSIKPIDKETIVKAAKETGAIITVEEHNLSGGVGSSVAEVLADEGLVGVRFRRLGLPDVYVTKIGCQRWLCEEYGIGPTGIKKAILDTV